MLPARTIAQIFLRPKKYPGCREFLFRPHLSRIDGRFDAVDVQARQGSFSATLCLRPDSTDTETFAQIFLYAHYRTHGLARHADIAAYYESCTKPLILDLGSNIGLSPLYFAKNWPRATIVGVEPDSGNYALFRHNIGAQKNIVPVCGAVASRHSRAHIINPHESAWGYRTELDEGNSGGLPAIPVTALLDQHRECQPFICKIDIEGAEQELFSANTEWIERFPVVIIELHDWLFPTRGSSANFLRVIASQERDFIVSGENVFSISHRMNVAGWGRAQDAIFKAHAGE